MKLDKSERNPILQDDILRYKKNKFAARFALLALVFNCLYFMLFYSINQAVLYKPLLGFSVILNLIVLLFGFYSSEGIKSYNKNFAYFLFALAAIQLARIFVYPTQGMVEKWLNGNFYFEMPMETSAQGAILIVYLAASCACFAVSGVYGFIAALRLEIFQKKLNSGELSVEETLKELDAKDEAASGAHKQAAVVEKLEAPVEEAPAEVEAPVEEAPVAEEAPVEEVSVEEPLKEANAEEEENG